MKSRYLGNIAICLGLITLFPGPVFWGQAASAPARTSNETDMSRAARLLRDIRADAEQVRSIASNMNALTASQSPKWADYDRQWNEIQPCMEDMDIRLARLLNMKSSLSAAENKDVDQSEQLVRELHKAANGFLNLLDKPGEQMIDSGFRNYARSLMEQSGRLERAAKVR